MITSESHECVSARQHGMMGATTETTPKRCANTTGGLTITTVKESSMAGTQSTQKNHGRRS